MLLLAICEYLGAGAVFVDGVSEFGEAVVVVEGRKKNLPEDGLTENHFGGSHQGS